jgi:predicted phosphodiesterase
MYHLRRLLFLKIIKRDLSDFDEIEIYALSDTHFEDSKSNHKKMYEWRAEVLAEDNRFVVINGDIINAATKNSKSDIYSSKDNPDGALDDVVEFLQPIADRILAIVGGNHEARIYNESGIKPMRRVARELGLVDLYTDEAYLLFVSFGKSQGRSCRKMVYSIYGRHGCGSGGKKVGSKANGLVDIENIIDADIYIQGHTHQSFATRKSFFRADYRNKKVTLVEKLFVNTNAWLDFGGYGEVLGFSPSSIKWPVITLNGIERKAEATI